MPKTQPTNAAAEAVADKTDGIMVREVAEAEGLIKAQTFIALEYPRNLETVSEEMMACTKSICEFDHKKAIYLFPRAGQDVTGIAAPLARDLAVCYGNNDFGFAIVSIDEQYVHIVGTFIDFQKNVRIRFPAKFRKLIQRKVKNDDGSYTTKWREPDERDLRELINKQGAIATRNAILSGIPEYLTRSVEAHALSVLREVAETNLQDDRQGTVDSMMADYHDLGISDEMIAVKLGHPVINVTPEELDELRQIHASIRDGNSSAAEYFSPEDPKPGKKAKNGKRKDGGASLSDVTEKQTTPKERAAQHATKAAAREQKPTSFIEQLAPDKRPELPGKFILQYIKSRKISATKVCDKAGIAFKELDLVVQGGVIPNPEFAELLSNALELEKVDSDFFKALCVNLNEDEPEANAKKNTNGDLFD